MDEQNNLVQQEKRTLFSPFKRFLAEGILVITVAFHNTPLTKCATKYKTKPPWHRNKTITLVHKKWLSLLHSTRTSVMGWVKIL